MSAPETGEEAVPPAQTGAAALLLTLVTLVLLLLAPLATRAQPEGRAWFLAPVNWPVLSLGFGLIGGGLLAWSNRAGLGRGFRDAFGGMGRAMLWALGFCLYLAACGWFGFGLATLGFLLIATRAAGLTGLRWTLITLAVWATIILIFRVGIGLWFPLAPVFKLMPPGIANTVGSIL